MNIIVFLSCSWGFFVMIEDMYILKIMLKN